MVRPSKYARRFTAYTPFAVSGPAAGHALMKTAADPAGRTVLGTLNNCASGMTPWGTYLSGEENWAFYFDGPEKPDADQTRWGMRKTSFYRWPEHDERFDAKQHPNEFHRFGWVVEIDPIDPTSTPVKRTALGRAAHEGAWIAITKDGRAVVYSGEDARFEYIYKFVSRDKIAPGRRQGQCHAARPRHAVRGALRRRRQRPLAAAGARPGAADRGQRLCRPGRGGDQEPPGQRPAGRHEDGPARVAGHRPARRGVLHADQQQRARRQGHARRGCRQPARQQRHGPDHPWTEDGDFDAPTMRWNHLLLAGDPANERPEARGNINGDIFACPDGLALDARGVLWVQTDMHASQMYKGELVRIGNNQMLACDRATGEVRRFFTGPVNCEVTGVDADAGHAHDVHQHPAPGRNRQRPQRPGRPGEVLELARLPARRPAARRPRWSSAGRTAG